MTKSLGGFGSVTDANLDPCAATRKVWLTAPHQPREAGSYHDFLHGLLDPVEQHLMWPMTRATGDEINNLHCWGAAFFWP